MKRVYSKEARENQYAKMKKRREDWFLANGPCKCCGSSVRLEVDHIDRETKVSHKVWSLCDEKRNAELAKCQVLCHECHQKKTVGENTKPWVHGVTAYKSGKCRCDVCREAQRINLIEWRTRTGRTSTYYNHQI